MWERWENSEVTRSERWNVMMWQFGRGGGWGGVG